MDWTRERGREPCVPVVNVAAVPRRSPLRYPAGKTWLIPHIREWLGHTKSEILIKPFASGAVVSLTADTVKRGEFEDALRAKLERIGEDHDRQEIRRATDRMREALQLSTEEGGA